MSTTLPPRSTPGVSPTESGAVSLSTLAGEFLHALGQTLAAMTLYGPRHPSRAAARDRSLTRLRELLAHHAPLRLTCLDGDVIADRQLLHDFRGWDWGQRLSAAGVQRIEFDHDVLDDTTYGLWLDQVHAAVSPGGSALSAPFATGSIRCGPVGLAGEKTAAVDEPMVEPGSGLVGTGDLGSMPLPADALRDELDALAWVQSRTAATNRIPAGEVEAVVRGLSFAMQAEHGTLLPLIALKSADEYTTVHACNVAMLAMGLAEQLAFSSRDVRAIGVAALLHDIGKVRLPETVLNKPGALTDAERAQVRNHTVEGARLLGERGSGYGLASIVAYEHHVWADGQGGYPSFAFTRTPHYVTRLVQVCDVYDALSTERPYRAAWPRARTLHHMRLQAGRELDYDLLLAFFDLLDRADRWQTRPR